MNSYAKLAIGAAAAAVLVAVVGVNLLSSRGDRGTAAPTASPSANPPPSADMSTELASPSRASGTVFPPIGTIGAGTYDAAGPGILFTFDLQSANWSSNGEYSLLKHTTALIFFGYGLPGGHPSGIYVDACVPTPGPPVEPTSDALAAAIAAIPGTTLVNGPTRATVGGYPAKVVAVRVPDDAACGDPGNQTPYERDFMLYWWIADDGTVEGRFAWEKGSTMRIWVVEVGDALLWIDGNTPSGAGPEAGEELQAIVDSIQFK